MAVRKLALRRKKVSIFEIGASMGENYLLLKDVMRRENLDVEVEFVGIDTDQNAVELARELHHGDPNFTMILGDGADLSRFPDRCFDVVCSNGVLNYVDNPESAFGNAVRLARVCAVLNILFSRTKTSFVVTYTGLERALAVTKSIILREVAPHSPIFIYDLNQYWGFQDFSRASEGSDGIFIGGATPNDMERKMLVFSTSIRSLKTCFWGSVSSH